MKSKAMLAAAVLPLLWLAGCQSADVDKEAKLRSREGKEFTAGLEGTIPTDEETKTFVDGDLYMYWTADDRLTIFTSTYNDQYRFEGQTGDNNGAFSKISSGQFVSGNPISTNYGVYPYNATTSMDKDEKISLVLPETQNYAQNSFGLGANTMVAVTGGKDDYFLPFKNVCGYLVVRLYGEGTVKRIKIEGNNGEKISGAATVTASHTTDPGLAMAGTATESITLDCGEGVTVGATAETATEFWIVIPPVTFTKGFTVTVEDDNNGRMVRKTTTTRTVQRNIVTRMAPIEYIRQIEFEDANFKVYCVSNFDKNGDGEISYKEAALVEEIHVSTDAITSMCGLEFFVNLTTLSCNGSKNSNGKLTSLDISKNISLQYLYCYNNQISKLDVRNNESLIYVGCAPNANLTDIYLLPGQTIKNGFDCPSTAVIHYIPLSVDIDKAVLYEILIKGREAYSDVIKARQAFEDWKADTTAKGAAYRQAVKDSVAVEKSAKTARDAAKAQNLATFNDYSVTAISQAKADSAAIMEAAKDSAKVLVDAVGDGTSKGFVHDVNYFYTQISTPDKDTTALRKAFTEFGAVIAKYGAPASQTEITLYNGKDAYNKVLVKKVKIANLTKADFTADGSICTKALKHGGDPTQQTAFGGITDAFRYVIQVLIQDIGWDGTVNLNVAYVKIGTKTAAQIASEIIAAAQVLADKETVEKLEAKIADLLAVKNAADLAADKAYNDVLTPEHNKVKNAYTAYQTSLSKEASVKNGVKKAINKYYEIYDAFWGYATGTHTVSIDQYSPFASESDSLRIK